MDFNPSQKAVSQIMLSVPSMVDALNVIKHNSLFFSLHFLKIHFVLVTGRSILITRKFQIKSKSNSTRPKTSPTIKGILRV